MGFLTVAYMGICGLGTLPCSSTENIDIIKYLVVWRDTVMCYAALFHGVPKGCIIGPLLFIIYMLTVGQILCKDAFDFQCYAEDTPL